LIEKRWRASQTRFRSLESTSLTMAIRTGGDKRGARAGRMTGGRRIGLASKDIPQFAPNFTVYVLPPDVVCLYSEDRKFFLHGELYCALASTIANGGTTFGDLVRELKRDFPSDKIHEAVNRLLDRRSRPPKRISGIVLCAFRRSMWRAQRSSAPRCASWAFVW
jgi:hypothetical protein